MPTRTPPSPAVAHYRGRVAGLSRDRAADDPEFVEAKRLLAGANLQAHIEKVLATVVLNDEQRIRLVELITSGGGV
jgi:hypothetical protein